MSASRGLVVRSQSGFYEVETEQGRVTARLRGRLKRGPQEGDIVALGDRVRLSGLQDGEAMIEEVEPRERALVRLAPRPQGLYEQVIIANPDQAFFVFSCADPEPRMRMLDRFLVIAEQQDIPAGIVASKVDLVGWWRARRMFGHYAKIGYPLFYTSAIKKSGLGKLRKALKNKVTVLAGPSGTGKSSLMNVVQPGLDLRIGRIRESSRKGRHTTVERAMVPLKMGGYVADTPGLKALALWNIEAEELDGYFPEIAPQVTHCEYGDCTHMDEPGCAVIAAVERGKIHPDRYESYVRLRLGQED